MVIRARVTEHIEIQGHRANDIKHSASWEATQVLLAIFLSMVEIFIICFQLCWVDDFARNRYIFLVVYFQDKRK